MKLLPQTAWFGLTPRRRQCLIKLAALAFGFVLIAYLSFYSYLRYELHRTTALLQKLKSIQIGQTDQSVRDILLPYEDKRVNRELLYKPEARVFFLDPWGAYSSFHWDWIRGLAFILSRNRSLRRALGLRVWMAFGEYRVDQGLVTR